MTHDPDDLAWLAFAYASGGLDPEASAAFEDRLDADQSAREAVAEAVLLAGSVASAESADRRRRHRRRLAAAGGVALAMAAAALAGAPRLLAPSVRRAEPDEPGAVALAWSGLRQDRDDRKGRDDLIEWLAEPPAPPDHPEPSAADHPDTLPPWLLDAASLPDGGDGRGI